MAFKDLHSEIVEIDDTQVLVEPWAWKFTDDRRIDIDRHFARLRQERDVWNGRVLLLHRCEVSDRKFCGSCFETDYASFTAWCDWDFPDPQIYNFYAAAAVRTADGAFLVGEMAPHTANAGALYFPCGTPEPTDAMADGRVDLEANVVRELLEETGIAAGELTALPGWRLVRDRNYIALIKVLLSPQVADELRDRIIRFLRADARAELSDVHILRGPGDFSPRLAKWVATFLGQAWSG